MDITPPGARGESAFARRALPDRHRGIAACIRRRRQHAGKRRHVGVTARGIAEDKIKTRGGDAFDVVDQTITIQPGGHSGRHLHPGQAIVVIKAGNFTTYDACDPTCTVHVYGPDDVYVDRGYGYVHLARNEGIVPTQLEITYIDVLVGEPFRTDAPSTGNSAF